MADVHDIKKEKAQRNTEFEYCVICWQKTRVRRNEPIETRVGYVEGVGQLCPRCMKDLYERGEL
ncbi:hypothetical protein SY88_00065 [Clostridiales bacterium PH28_bin88]|nr:hypothetical protein SY88_00065 [Clostridiales bacterium PH28_bin88]